MPDVKLEVKEWGKSLKNPKPPEVPPVLGAISKFQPTTCFQPSGAGKI